MTSEADDYFSRLERKKLILSFMESGEWRKILEYYDSNEKYREPNLVWIKPSIDMLQFIEICLMGNLSRVTKDIVEWQRQRTGRIH